MVQSCRVIWKLSFLLFWSSVCINDLLAQTAGDACTVNNDCTTILQEECIGGVCECIDGYGTPGGDTRCIADCGEVTAPANGNVAYTNGNTLYESIAVFICNTGFGLIGDTLSRTCTADGTWSGTTPTCVIDCGALTTPTNGSMNLTSGTTYGSVATFSCDTGYTLTGLASITCGMTGNWDGTEPTCVIKDCGSITAPSNGVLTYSSGTTYNSVATFTCDIGYTLIGDITSTCEDTCEWSANPPTCVIKDCGSITAPSNGDLTFSSGTTYNSVATFTCDIGYTLTGDITSTCEETSDWSANPPTCVIKDCGSITAPSNGDLTFSSGTTYNSVATFTCDIGFTLTGDITSTCEDTSEWSANPPTCVIKDCGSITAPSNGDLTFSSGTTYNSVAFFTCDIGYTLTGDITSTCEDTSEWSANPPTCVIKDCGPMTAPANGGVGYSAGTTYSSLAVFTCALGYTLNGNNPLTCQANGAWSDLEPFCNINDCGVLPTPNNGALNLQSTTYGSVGTFTCDVGYEMTGDTSSVCQSDGSWSNQGPACLITDCGALLQPRNGDVTLSSGTTYSSVASYTCDPGYTLTGDSNITCQEDSNWSSAAPVCKDKDLSGNVIRTCRDDGVWTLLRYNCISKEFRELEKKVMELQTNPSTEKVLSALYDLSSITEATSSKDVLYEGELQSATNMLETIANVSNRVEISTTQSRAFVGTASNLLDTKNQIGWQAVSETNDDDSVNIKEGAPRVLQAIDTYAASIAKNVSTEDPHIIIKKNVVLHVAKIADESDQKDIHFPSASLHGISTKSSISLQRQHLKDVSSYSAVLYKNLTGILPSNSDQSEKDKEYEINSVVLSLDLHRSEEPSTKQLDVTIVLVHFQQAYRDPLCSYWNTEKYAWDSDGCTLQLSNSTTSVCKCTHLTSFAILMSPWTEDNVVSTAMDIISIVGCSLSMLFLTVTIMVHIILWKYLKSDRVVVLMNLSVALIVSYALFIGGVDKTEIKGACTAVAVLLQYIYLVVFFLMLTEGIELAFAILYVFATKSRIKWLLPMAWGFPAVLVGISVGATKTKGYGTEDFCWLSVEDGLIWSFVGPAVLISMINFVLLIMIIRKMFKVKTLIQKSAADKVKTGVRSLCILIPLMGCTWILGLFYVNKDFTWVQYVFAACNSLQGLVIFIFHCAMNQQIHGACQRKRKKYYDSRSLPTKTTKPLSNSRVSESFDSIVPMSGNSVASHNSISDYQEDMKDIHFEMRQDYRLGHLSEVDI